MFAHTGDSPPQLSFAGTGATVVALAPCGAAAAGEATAVAAGVFWVAALLPPPQPAAKSAATKTAVKIRIGRSIGTTISHL